MMRHWKPLVRYDLIALRHLVSERSGANVVDLGMKPNERQREKDSWGSERSSEP